MYKIILTAAFLVQAVTVKACGSWSCIPRSMPAVIEPSPPAARSAEPVTETINASDIRFRFREDVAEWKYFEFYRITKGEQTFFLHGTCHFEKLEEIPVPLKAAIDGCAVSYTEQFSLEGANEIDPTDILRKETDPDPDLLTYLKTHKVAMPGAASCNVFEFLKEKVPSVTFGDHTIDLESIISKLRPCFAPGIILSSFSSQQVYEPALQGYFRGLGKSVNGYESFSDVFDASKADQSEEVEEIDLKVLAKSMILQLYIFPLMKKIIEKTYRLGLTVWGALKDENSHGNMIHGRTNLWFSKLFEEGRFTKEQDALLCMGTSHLFEHDGKPGFLRKLHDTGWKIENLTLDGVYRPFDIIPHEEARRRLPLNIHVQLIALQRFEPVEIVE